MSDTHKVMTADRLPSKYYFRVFSAISQICLLMIYECARDFLSCAHCIFVVFRSFLFCGFSLSSCCLTLLPCHRLTFFIQATQIAIWVFLIFIIMIPRTLLLWSIWDMQFCISPSMWHLHTPRVVLPPKFLITNGNVLMSLSPHLRCVVMAVFTALIPWPCSWL